MPLSAWSRCKVDTRVGGGRGAAVMSSRLGTFVKADASAGWSQRNDTT